MELQYFILTDLSQVTELFFLAFDILNNAVVNNMVVLFLYSAIISLEYIYRGKIDRSNKRMHLKF